MFISKIYILLFYCLPCQLSIKTIVLYLNRVKLTRYKSKGSIYIYSKDKELLAIVPIGLALSLGNRSIRLLVKRAIIKKPLHRYYWYLSIEPFNINDKPKYTMGSEDYKRLVIIAFS